MTPEDLIQSLPPLGGVLREAREALWIAVAKGNDMPAGSVEASDNAAALAVARVVVEHVLRELEKQKPVAWTKAETAETFNTCRFNVAWIFSGPEGLLSPVPLYAAPHPRSEE